MNGTGYERLSERPARVGERCTCGRPAVVVYEGGRFGEVGYCGVPDRRPLRGPCPFCDADVADHAERRCPHYRLRPTLGRLTHARDAEPGGAQR